MTMSTLTTHLQCWGGDVKNDGHSKEHNGTAQGDRGFHTVDHRDDLGSC